ncbi:hypothetical protein JNJ66_06185 [Candidatus Saccharibacteria bacterium]|nr:hypothetical protein [Candidatus Saccharibacteria bacterium]
MSTYLIGLPPTAACAIKLVETWRNGMLTGLRAPQWRRMTPWFDGILMREIRGEYSEEHGTHYVREIVFTFQGHELATITFRGNRHEDGTAWRATALSFFRRFDGDEAGDQSGGPVPQGQQPLHSTHPLDQPTAALGA